jgi:hypothetical protein
MFRTVRNFYGRAGILLGVILLACAFVCTRQAAAAPAMQATTGTVTGQVISLDNVPLPNVKLSAWAQEPGTPNRTQLGQYQSDAQGRYSADVPPGQVWMQFETQDVLGQSFWGYDNKPVDVVAGQTISNQDFVVAIRVVSEPPTAVPAPPTAVPAPPTPEPTVLPGMPTTGSGPDMRLPLLAVLGLTMLVLGLVLVQRRRVSR